VDAEAVVGPETRPFVALFGADGLLDADEFLGRVLLLDARRPQQKNKRPGAAVHDRHFGRVHINVQVVYAETRHRRQQVLDRRDANIAAPEGRGHSRVNDILRRRGDVHRLVEVNPVKNNAGAGSRRAQGHVNSLAGMQTDADSLN